MSQVKSCILLFASFLSVNGLLGAPFMASVRFNSYLLCGGTIIHSQFVLTTTNCVPESPSYYTVYVGVHEYNTLGMKHRVATIIRNEPYTYEKNIALLKLTKKIIFSATVQKIDLAPSDLILRRDTRLMVLGWGLTKKSSTYKELQEISVSVITQSECRKEYSFLSPEVFCTRGNDGFCDRAEGGPAILDNIQVGVLTDRMSCTGLPHVYISLAPFSNWITESIELNL